MEHGARKYLQGYTFCQKCSNFSRDKNSCDNCLTHIPAKTNLLHAARLRREELPLWLDICQKINTKKGVEKVYNFSSGTSKEQSCKRCRAAPMEVVEANRNLVSEDIKKEGPMNYEELNDSNSEDSCGLVTVLDENQQLDNSSSLTKSINLNTPNKEKLEKYTIVNRVSQTQILNEHSYQKQVCNSNSEELDSDSEKLDSDTIMLDSVVEKSNSIAEIFHSDADVLDSDSNKLDLDSEKSDSDAKTLDSGTTTSDSNSEKPDEETLMNRVVEIELDDDSEEEDSTNEDSLPCRSIRIGTYHVHSPHTTPYMAVSLQGDSLIFKAPLLSKPDKSICISLHSDDIEELAYHFGSSLEVMFVSTTPRFSKSVRNILHMIQNETQEFDSSYKAGRIRILTFLFETMTEDQKTLIRQILPGEKKVKEIDEMTAHKILVLSTLFCLEKYPNRKQTIQRKKENTQMSEREVEAIDSDVEITQKEFCLEKYSNRKQTIQRKKENTQMSERGVKAINSDVEITQKEEMDEDLSKEDEELSSEPVVKLFTYPPPPQTGGIEVTNADLRCLAKDKFLNDVIIDFYLKYIFYEKLSVSDQKKTHIFSSFFYSKLTFDHKNSSEEESKEVKLERHSQVKRWTRHVDIFSKDYIIMPINEEDHWFLAIICYPNRILDVPKAPETEAAEHATSSDQQENVNKNTLEEISCNVAGCSMDKKPLHLDKCSTASNSYTDSKQINEMPCICIFDSVHKYDRLKVVKILRAYLEIEWENKKGTLQYFGSRSIPGFIMDCPQQRNNSDCGVYLLEYAESFFDNLVPFTTPTVDLGIKLSHWFSEDKITKKREELKDLILSLQKKLPNAVQAQHQEQNKSSSNK